MLRAKITEYIVPIDIFCIDFETPHRLNYLLEASKPKLFIHMFPVTGHIMFKKS